MAFNIVALETEPGDTCAWYEEAGFWSDDIEDVVRRYPPYLRAASRQPLGNVLPRFERPVRRRLSPEEIRVKSHRTFTMTTMPALGLRTGLDPSEPSSSCSPVTVVTSATSSAGTPWSTSGRFEEIFEDEGTYNCEQAEHYQQDDEVVIPKLEPLEELDMDDLCEVEDTPMHTLPTQTSPVAAPIKRGRGRPRKYPKPDPAAMAKVHKGRSKTGCGTCRKRKKKCDEARPICELRSCVGVQKSNFS